LQSLSWSRPSASSSSWTRQGRRRRSATGPNPRPLTDGWQAPRPGFPPFLEHASASASYRRPDGVLRSSPGAFPRPCSLGWRPQLAAEVVPSERALDWPPGDGIPIPSGMTSRTSQAMSLLAAVGVAGLALAQTPAPQPSTPPTPTTNQTTYAPMPARAAVTDGGMSGQAAANSAPATPSWSGKRLGPDGGVIQ
jgi:hypothetical protein